LIFSQRLRQSVIFHEVLKNCLVHSRQYLLMMLPLYNSSKKKEIPPY
jgi:hypothetical protein